MKKALALITVSSSALLLPLVASAAVLSNATDVGSFVVNFINGVVVPVLFAIAFIVFLWGAFQTFILGAQNEDTKEKGRNLMLWGLIGFFVMVSIWGLVGILTGTISFSQNAPNLPSSGVNVGG